MDAYTVLKGETLASIAKRFYGDSARWTEIATANNIGPEGLTVGAKIKIPSSEISELSKPYHGTTIGAIRVEVSRSHKRPSYGWRPFVDTGTGSLVAGLVEFFHIVDKPSDALALAAAKVDRLRVDTGRVRYFVDYDSKRAIFYVYREFSGLFSCFKREGWIRDETFKPRKSPDSRGVAIILEELEGRALNGLNPGRVEMRRKYVEGQAYADVLADDEERLKKKKREQQVQVQKTISGAFKSGDGLTVRETLLGTSSEGLVEKLSSLLGGRKNASLFLYRVVESTTKPGGGLLVDIVNNEIERLLEEGDQ